MKLRLKLRLRLKPRQRSPRPKKARRMKKPTAPRHPKRERRKPPPPKRARTKPQTHRQKRAKRRPPPPPKKARMGETRPCPRWGARRRRPEEGGRSPRRRTIRRRAPARRGYLSLVAFRRQTKSKQSSISPRSWRIANSLTTCRRNRNPTTRPRARRTSCWAEKRRP